MGDKAQQEEQDGDDVLDNEEFVRATLCQNRLLK